MADETKAPQSTHRISLQVALMKATGLPVSFWITLALAVAEAEVSTAGLPPGVTAAYKAFIASGEALTISIQAGV